MRLLRIQLRATDFWWLLAAPVYILIGTIRHETSHAIVAIAQGASLVEFCVIPSRDFWGYVRFEGGHTTWLVSAAPYLGDVITYAVGILLCLRMPPRRRALFINVAAIGVVTPLIDSANAYIGALRGRGDVAWLLLYVPAPVVHGYFGLTLLAYGLGIMVILYRSRMAVEGPYHVRRVAE